MRHDFNEFIRNGQDGEYIVATRDGALHGRRPRLSLKSTFPNYSVLRTTFEDRLDGAIRENTRTLLNALTPPDTIPVTTEAGLCDLSDAKKEALRQWDLRLDAISEDCKPIPSGCALFALPWKNG